MSEEAVVAFGSRYSASQCHGAQGAFDGGGPPAVGGVFIGGGDCVVGARALGGAQYVEGDAFVGIGWGAFDGGGPLAVGGAFTLSLIHI